MMGERAVIMSSGSVDELCSRRAAGGECVVAEVDVLLAQAERAGATLTGRPHDRPWGIYSGYFRDPDGHLWEIIWNPPDENTTQ